MFRNILKYTQLGKHERSALTKAWWRLLVNWWRIRILHSRSITSEVHGYLVGTVGLSNRVSAAETRKMLVPVHQALRNHLVHCNCLMKCLASLKCLEDHGMTADLRIGVSLDQQQQLQGHAWLEVDGEVVNDRQDVNQHYRVLKVPGRSLPKPSRFD